MIQVKRGTYSAIQNLTPADGQIVAEKASDGKYDGIRIGNGKDRVSALPKISAGLPYNGYIDDPDTVTKPGIYGCQPAAGTSNWTLPDFDMSAAEAVLIVPYCGDGNGSGLGWVFQVLQVFDGMTSQLFHRVYDDVHGYWGNWVSEFRASSQRSILATSISDMDTVISGVYTVSFGSQFIIGGGSDVSYSGDEGVLVVFNRSATSAFQLLLYLNTYNRNEDCRCYWRFVQNDSNEEYVLPGTGFKRM